MSRIPLIAPRRTVVRATAASALALLALAGCTSLAPDYARPMLPVPATLNGTNGPDGPEGTALTPETGPMGWQEFLQEPRLHREGPRAIRRGAVQPVPSRGRHRRGQPHAHGR